jgi:hypothetical protein
MNVTPTPPTRPRRAGSRARGLVTIVAVGVLVAAGGTAVSATADGPAHGSARHAQGAATDEDRGPRYGAPDPDACYDVPIEAADKAALHVETVPCEQRHSLWIVGVPVAPRSVEFDGSMKFWRFVVRACVAAQDEAIGRNTSRYLRTVYQNFFFVPTKAQQRHGAHWISCELGWLVGNERLVRTTRVAPPRLRPHMSDEVNLCMDRYRTQCSQPHQWRAVYGAIVRGQPTDAAVRRAARRICPQHTDTRRWNYAYGGPMGLDSFAVSCHNRTRR